MHILHKKSACCLHTVRAIEDSVVSSHPLLGTQAMLWAILGNRNTLYTSHIFIQPFLPQNASH